MLWLLSQPPERGGPGFDPITARKLTIEAAMFYLSSETDTKRRCAAENRRSDPEDCGKTRLELLQEQMLALRLKFTGSADPYAEPGSSHPQADDDFEAES